MLEHVPTDVTLTVTASRRRRGSTRRSTWSSGSSTTATPSSRTWRRASSRIETHLASSSPGWRTRSPRRLRRGRRRRSPGRARTRAPRRCSTTCVKLGHPFAEIGITGYPESHPFIDDATTIEAMFAEGAVRDVHREPDLLRPGVTARWIEDVWARGTRLPIYVGIPGAVQRAKLLRVSTRIGIGDSLRFLRKNGSFVSRFLHPAASARIG